ncbi:MAG: BLUF domain-containing protein [Alphaproteobacteria bacterium]|nr:MAG: BLUF domain-containing protein [Alphaproteobacteria bacterium]
MDSLCHFIYASAAAQPFDREALQVLLRQAQTNNERCDLTGMLLYIEGSFLQVLEGDPGVVEEAYDKIARDARHTKVTKILAEPIAQRQFGSWTMGLGQVTKEDLRNEPGLNDFFGEGRTLDELDEGRAKRLLAAFAEGNWRLTA